MDFFRLLSSMFLIIIVVGANHDNLEPQVYWRTVLPHTPMPSVIKQLLQPRDVYDEKSDTSVSVGKNGVNVNTGEGTSVNVGNGGVNVKPYDFVKYAALHDEKSDTSVSVGKNGVNVNTGEGTSVDVGDEGVNVKPYDFVKYAASDTQLHDDPAVALFFLRKDLRPGKKFTLQLTYKAADPTGAFISRSAAESVPFSTAELPSILSRFSIPVGSVEAAGMKNTLSECEAAPAAGEMKWCATSLESMVDFATTSLGTWEVVAVATEGGAAAGERRVYRTRLVRRVAAAGGKGVVACHPEPYAYAVFFCHATTASEVYLVDMEEAESGGTAVKAVAVCHTDTAGWNPKHLAFRVLNVKPGTVPVCHFLPQDHVVWAGKA